MKKKLLLTPVLLTVLLFTPRAHAQVVLTDNFSGNEGASQSATTPYSNDNGSNGGGFSLNDGVLTFGEYYAQDDNASSTYTLSDTAGAGPSGAAALVSSMNPATGQVYGGITTSGIQLTFTPGSITAAELSTVDVSFEFSLNDAYGFNFAINPVSDANGDGIGGASSIGYYSNGNSSNTGGNFEQVTINFGSQSNSTLQSFANSLNSVDSNYIGLQVIDSFNGSDPNAESESLANLSVQETPTPEPSTWAMMGLAGLGLVFLVRRRARC